MANDIAGRADDGGGPGARGAASAGRPQLWIIDDEARWGRATLRVLARVAPEATVRLFTRLADADEALALTRPAGVLVDERLGRTARGCAWIARNRRALAQSYVVLCTGDPSANARAFSQGVDLLLKPVAAAALKLFAQRATGARRTRPTLAALAAAFCSERALSPTQSRIVELSLHGMRRQELANELRMRPSTVKSHVRDLLRRAQAQDMQEVITTIVASGSR